jgi:hypothetical protein
MPSGYPAAAGASFGPSASRIAVFFPIRRIGGPRHASQPVDGLSPQALQQLAGEIAEPPPKSQLGVSLGRMTHSATSLHSGGKQGHDSGQAAERALSRSASPKNHRIPVKTATRRAATTIWWEALTRRRHACGHHSPAGSYW